MFQARGLTAAQVLLTLGDTEERRRYLNARRTMDMLISCGAVPVVNGREFVAAAGEGASRCLDVHFHDGAGHDQDRVEAPRRSHEFLGAYLFRGRPAKAACRHQAGRPRSR